MNFNFSPSSLKNLAKTTREKQASVIRSIQIDMEDGAFIVSRGPDSRNTTYYSNLNIYSDSLVRFEKIIGTENIGFITGLRQMTREQWYLDLEATNKTPVLGWDSSSGWYAYSGNTVSPNVLSSIQASLSTKPQNVLIPDNETSIQYGDNEFKNFTGLPVQYADYLEGGKNSDELYGLLGNDTLDGKNGDDYLYGGYGSDLLIGGEGNDTLYGEQSNDSLFGGSGNDYIDGGLGVDTMIGGDGNDRYLVDNVNDTVIDGQGIDTILIPQYISFTLPDNIEAARLTGNDDSSVTGNTLNNTLTGNEGDNQIDGGVGNDTINGGFGNDTIKGGSGNDSIVGGAGDNMVIYTGNSQNLTINLGSGLATGDGTDSLSEIENVTAGSGADNIIGDSLNNSLSGGAGNDTFNGGAGNDSFVGGVGIDLVNYGANTQNLAINLLTGIATGDGTDSLSEIENVTAGSGADNIIGDSLNNSLSGGAGNDTFNGGAGNDTLYGSSNTANGGKGEIDKISGGAGTDLFVLGTAAAGRFYDDGIVSDGGRSDYAVITDFTTGSDQLQLKGVANNYFLGASGVTGVTGSGVFFDSNNNRSLDTGDELIAILQSANATALTVANTINVTKFV